MIGLQVLGVRLTRKAAAAILETAVSAGYTHGIGYWADVITLKGGTRNPVMVLRDRDEKGEPEYTITQQDLERALTLMLSSAERTACRGVIGQVHTEDYADGPLSDVIVQVACFGEVKYS